MCTFLPVGKNKNDVPLDLVSPSLLQLCLSSQRHVVLSLVLFLPSSVLFPSHLFFQLIHYSSPGDNWPHVIPGLLFINFLK